MYKEGLPVLFRFLFCHSAFHFGGNSDTRIQEIPEEIKIIFPFPRFNIDDLSFRKGRLLIHSLLSFIDWMQR